MAALRRWQIVEGMGDPFLASWPLLEYTLRGIKLKQAQQAEFRPKPRYPMTPKVLRLLRDFWEEDKEDRDHIMLWATCCMLFFGFLRAGEVTVPSMRQYDPGCHLSVGDVKLDSLVEPSLVSVNIKA